MNILFQVFLSEKKDQKPRNLNVIKIRKHRHTRNSYCTAKGEVGERTKSSYLSSLIVADYI